MFLPSNAPSNKCQLTSGPVNSNAPKVFIRKNVVLKAIFPTLGCMDTLLHFKSGKTFVTSYLLSWPMMLNYNEVYF